MRPGRGISARASGSGGPTWSPTWYADSQQNRPAVGVPAQTGQPPCVTPPVQNVQPSVVQPPAQNVQPPHVQPPAQNVQPSASVQLPAQNAQQPSVQALVPPPLPAQQPPLPAASSRDLSSLDIEQLLAFLPSDGIYGVAALRSMIEQRLAAQAAAVEPLAEAVLPPTPAEPAQPQHVCGMCYELLADKAHEALVPCGHTFHSSCIEKWMKSYRLPRTRCCIYKCFRTQLLVVDGVNDDEPTGFDALASSSADGQQPPPLVSQAITAIIGAFPPVEEVPPTPVVAADEPASQPLLDALQQALDNEVTAAGPNPRDID